MRKRRVALDVATCAMMSAMLTTGKLALSWAANVEVVSVLIVLFALSLGLRRTLIAVNCFILTEVMLYPAHIWIPCYFIHFNSFAVIMYLVAKPIENSRLKKVMSVLLGVLAAFLTFLFGILTTSFEVLIGNSIYSFWKAFGIRYAAGTWYFVTHITCNFLTVSILLPILLPVLRKLVKAQGLDKGRSEPVAETAGNTDAEFVSADLNAEPNKPLETSEDELLQDVTGDERPPAQDAPKTDMPIKN